MRNEQLQTAIMLKKTWPIGTAKQFAMMVLGKGPTDTPLDWSISHERGTSPGQQHNEVITALVPPHLTNPTIYCPDPRTFNGKIVWPGEFIHYNQLGNQTFWYGLPTAGVMMRHDSAVIIATGDCPTLVIRDQDTHQAIVCHAGLGELIDLPLARSGNQGKPSRDHVSVIDQVFEKFTKDNINDPARLTAHIVCGIEINHFTHPFDDLQWGVRNWNLINYLRKHFPDQEGAIWEEAFGGIDLAELITCQLIKRGLKNKQINRDHLDTYTDQRLWSHRRSTTTGDPAGRNLVVVTNW